MKVIPENKVAKLVVTPARPVRVTDEKYRPIGLRKPLDKFVEGDLLATGLTRREARKMTPTQLRDLANLAVDANGRFIGS